MWVNIPRSLTRKNILWLQMLLPPVLRVTLTLHPRQAAWLFLQITNLSPQPTEWLQAKQCRSIPAAGWDNLAMLSSTSTGHGWSVLQVAIPLLFWLHPPRCEASHFPPSQGTTLQLLPWLWERSSTLSMNPVYLTNCKDSPGLLLELVTAITTVPIKPSCYLTASQR